MRRPLPSDAEAREILSRKRTRPRHRPPPPASRSLSGFIKALDARFGPGTGGLESRWPEIVGEALARVSEPVKLSKGRGGAGGVLELRVVGPAAAFVQHQADDIMARANMVLGQGAVERLRISQGPVKPRQQPARRDARPASAPLGAAEDEALRRSLEDAPTERLREALTRLGRHVLPRS